MATLMGLKKLVDYMLEKYPEFADDSIYAEHDRIYLSKPDSEEEFNHLVEKAKEFGLFVSEEEGSLIIFV